MIRKWEKIRLVLFLKHITNKRYKTSFNWNDKKLLEVEDCRR